MPHVPSYTLSPGALRALEEMRGTGRFALGPDFLAEVLAALDEMPTRSPDQEQLRRELCRMPKPARESLSRAIRAALR